MYPCSCIYVYIEWTNVELGHRSFYANNGRSFENFTHLSKETYYIYLITKYGICQEQNTTMKEIEIFVYLCLLFMKNKFRCSPPLSIVTPRPLATLTRRSYGPFKRERLTNDLLHVFAFFLASSMSVFSNNSVSFSTLQYILLYPDASSLMVSVF